MKNLNNITAKEFEKILLKIGCELKRTSGSHKVYRKEGNPHSIVIPFHSNKALPIFIIKNSINTLKLTNKEFRVLFQNKK